MFHLQTSSAQSPTTTAHLSSAQPNTKCTAHDSLMRGTNRDQPDQLGNTGNRAHPPPLPQRTTPRYATLLRAPSPPWWQIWPSRVSRSIRLSQLPFVRRQSTVDRTWPDSPPMLFWGHAAHRHHFRQPHTALTTAIRETNVNPPRGRLAQTSTKAWRSPCPPRSGVFTTPESRLGGRWPVDGWAAGKWTVGAREARHQDRHLANPISP